MREKILTDAFIDGVEKKMRQRIQYKDFSSLEKLVKTAEKYVDMYEDNETIDFTLEFIKSVSHKKRPLAATFKEPLDKKDVEKRIQANKRMLEQVMQALSLNKPFWQQPPGFNFNSNRLQAATPPQQQQNLIFCEYCIVTLLSLGWSVVTVISSWQFSFLWHSEIFSGVRVNHSA